MRNILLREVGEYLHAERHSVNGEYSEKINAITAGIVEMKVLAKKPDNAAVQQKYIAATEELTAEEYLIKGKNALGNGFYQLAKEYFHKTIEIDPNDMWAWCGMGNANLYQEDYPEAITCYEKAIAISPNFVPAWNNMGRAYIKQQNCTKAISCFEKSIEIYPNDRFPWYYMGLAYYYYLGNNSQAVECYKKAAKLGYTDAQEWLESMGYDY